MPNTREKLIELLICADDYEVAVCKEYPCRNCKYRGEDCTYKAKASHLVSHGVTVQKWIPVTERLPERYKNVLTIRTDGKIRFDAIGSLDVWYEEVNYVGYPVTHWMPLPEPPKGE